MKKTVKKTRGYNKLLTSLRLPRDKMPNKSRDILNRGNELIIDFGGLNEKALPCMKYNGQYLRKQQKIKRKRKERTDLKTRNEIISLPRDELL